MFNLSEYFTDIGGFGSIAKAVKASIDWMSGRTKAQNELMQSQAALNRAKTDALRGANAAQGELDRQGEGGQAAAVFTRQGDDLLVATPGPDGQYRVDVVDASGSMARQTALTMDEHDRKAILDKLASDGDAYCIVTDADGNNPQAYHLRVDSQGKVVMKRDTSVTAQVKAMATELAAQANRLAHEEKYADPNRAGRRAACRPTDQTGEAAPEPAA
jgi:hypothetical protein